MTGIDQLNVNIRSLIIVVVVQTIQMCEEHLPMQFYSHLIISCVCFCLFFLFFLFMLENWSKSMIDLKPWTPIISGKWCHFGYLALAACKNQRTNRLVTFSIPFFSISILILAHWKMDLSARLYPTILWRCVFIFAYFFNPRNVNAPCIHTR